MKSLKEKFNKEITQNLKKEMGVKNVNAVPKITKVTVNTGIGRFMADQKAQEEIVRDLTLITGQKPKASGAKQAIAGFKIREGQIVGYSVTLRKQRMFDFLEKFINTALPRTRDFRGIDKKCVDLNGNLNIGIKEQIVFPEIAHENIRVIFSLQVVISSTAKNKQEGEMLFSAIGIPFKK